MKTFIFFLLYMMFVFSACSQSEGGNQDETIKEFRLPERKLTPYAPIALTPNEAKLSASNNEFAIRLFKQVSETDKPNICISPLSAAYALAMTANGAAGQTLTEMNETLGFGEYTNDMVNAFYKKLTDELLKVDGTTFIGIANSLWLSNLVKAKMNFVNTNEANFNAKVSTLDFRDPNSLTTINNWVEEKTYGYIPTLIEKLDPLSRIILINALYFDGLWDESFVPQATAKADFTNSDGSRTSVNMMELTSSSIESHTTSDGLQIAKLDYGNSAYSMYILLSNVEHTLDATMAKLTPGNWEQWTNALTSTKKIHLKLPKFKLEYTHKLNEDLKVLGMPLAFDEKSADFSHMATTPPPLYISEVLQKILINVDEYGTQASGASEVNVFTIISGHETESQTVDFVVDHPFLFIIQENSTGTILFIGGVTKL